MNKAHLVFAGQGSQFVGMGQDFYDQFPAAKAYLSKPMIYWAIQYLIYVLMAQTKH